MPRGSFAAIENTNKPRGVGSAGDGTACRAIVAQARRPDRPGASGDVRLGRRQSSRAVLFLAEERKRRRGAAAPGFRDGITGEGVREREAFTVGNGIATARFLHTPARACRPETRRAAWGRRNQPASALRRAAAWRLSRLTNGNRPENPAPGKGNGTGGHAGAPGSGRSATKTSSVPCSTVTVGSGRTYSLLTPSGRSAVRFARLRG